MTKLTTNYCKSCETLATRCAALEEEGDALEIECHELRDSNDALRALVLRASRDSCVTTSDEPGCFYCDHEEHTADCPAAKALGLNK